MPSELLTALYNQRADEGAALASRLPRLDVFEAASMGDAARIRDVLSADSASARAWSDDGFTPLHLAAFFARPQCMRMLIDAGADPTPARETRWRCIRCTARSLQDRCPAWSCYWRREQIQTRGRPVDIRRSTSWLIMAIELWKRRFSPPARTRRCGPTTAGT